MTSLTHLLRSSEKKLTTELENSNIHLPGNASRDITVLCIDLKLIELFFFIVQFYYHLRITAQVKHHHDISGIVVNFHVPYQTHLMSSKYLENGLVFTYLRCHVNIHRKKPTLNSDLSISNLGGFDLFDFFC